MQEMSLWRSLGTHSHLILPLTLASSHRIFNSCRHLLLSKNKKVHKALFSHVLSFSFFSRFLTLTQSITNPTHWATEVWQHLFNQRGKNSKKTHPPSNTVYAGWRCVLGWQSIYTWEEGDWYWDLPNICVAKDAMPPGKLRKSWWTAEETSMKSFPKKKDQRKKNQMLKHSCLYQGRFTTGSDGGLRYSCMLVNRYGPCAIILV